MRRLMSFLMCVALLLIVPKTTRMQRIDLESFSSLVLSSLSIKDTDKLAEFVHPVKGVRFSPYEFVESSHRVFTASQIKSADKGSYVWGNYDGSGLPITLTFSNYLSRFVNDKDYLHAPQINKGSIVGKSNTINNIAKFYPDSSWMEYHFPESSNVNDWKSLWLVFEEYKGALFLVGVVHGEWTI